MKKNHPIWLIIWGAPERFYTHIRLSPGYCFDTKQPLDPALGEYFCNFLQIFKHQNPDSPVQTDALKYTLFDWDTNELSASTRFSEIDLPRIVLAVHATDALQEVARVRIHLETLPEPNRDLQAWLKEIEPEKQVQSKSVTIAGGTFINSPILSNDASIHTTIHDVLLGSTATAVLEALSQLKSEITRDTSLQPFEQRSALRDVEELSETLSTDNPKVGAVQHYLERLKVIAEKSTTLIKPVIDIIKMLTGG